MTPFPAPNRLHVWFARRPLVASRAAILGSLLPPDADRDRFKHVLGIHGDPVEASKEIAAARLSGIRVKNPYKYDRAFQHSPTESDCDWVIAYQAGETIVLDPTAGGGSIPFETARLGLHSIANDLNSVAWLVLKCTAELPLKHGQALSKRYHVLGRKYLSCLKPKLDPLFPRALEKKAEDATYLWARTIVCPYCGGLVPLSPNWKLDSSGRGVRLHPDISGDTRRIRFEIVEKAADHSAGTVDDGTAHCPFPDCDRIIEGDEIKRQAQLGEMGQQLYCVVYKQEQITGYTKAGKAKTKLVRGFRAPRPEDDNDREVRQRLAEKMPEWQARNIVPDEEFPPDTNDSRPLQYGMPLWRDMFSPRQLFGHCTSVEVFHNLMEQLTAEAGGELPELDRAALCYVAIAIDKVLNYNSISSHWDSVRVAIRGKFDRHDFSHKWSFGEMAPTITGLGYDWAIEQTGKSLRELNDLLGHSTLDPELVSRPKPNGSVEVCRSSADDLALPDHSVDCIVMDPPYYDNVMYAGLSDFFYVWLKRTAGLLYPEGFSDRLTDKDHEAVANPARFAGQKLASAQAHADYKRRMAAIFQEQRRVLKPKVS